MPRINIQHDCGKDAEETFSKIRDFFQSDKDIKKLDPKIEISLDEAKKQGKATGSQFKASFEVKPSSKGSAVSLVVDLPLLLTPFKGKIEETILNKLKTYLA